ncbi:D-alanine--D-alanine ligase [Borreliella lusitaniae]|uniref:D-alanine--D-alanine ligase n=1 Tax=Borreliella lusitaniae TaxID=100177 RepID=UPI0026477B8F|nr:D-alanine--D-alanine ligase [Borreliella lusitaniae]WKC85137.1 D-alanine--D-alanine ligase [Borreliella lusitaniae]
MQKNLMLIFGGVSFEHEISCKSAYSIYLALLDLNKYNIYPVYIDKCTGIWYLLDSVCDPPKLINIDILPIVSLLPGLGFFSNNKNLEIDVVFPVVHGRTGEDGAIQGVLKVMDIPCVGAGIVGSAISSNKYFCKLLLKSFNIPLVPFIGFRQYDYSLDKEEVKKNIKELLGYPVIVKPSVLGSSIGINVAYSENQIESLIEEALKYDSTIVIEKFIEAREIECSIIGNEKMKIFSPGEIVVQDFIFYDYDAKYSVIPGNSIVFNIPAHLETNQFLSIKEYTFLVYKSLELRGMARVDFFVEKKSGTIYLNEINTIPGFTDISMFAKMCSHDGLQFKDLVDNLIDYAFQSFINRKKMINFED